ncbi:MAG: molybdate ABC transporter substrate-binding protein [Acidobacteria bacterium]|nr:molybdate ABC transporter substrate-binding protein [Acidobacteriota bacterium]
MQNHDTHRFPIVVTLLTILCFRGAQAGEVLVAAASDLNFAIREIIAEFEAKTGHSVKLSLGSSGNFYSEIVNGAPFDVFLSADLAYVRHLQEAGLVEPHAVFTYAVGRLVIWIPKGSPVDVGELGIKTLLHPSVKKIALANPRHAPYGQAAIAVLQHFKVYDDVKGRLVYGENISQATQFVESGAADAGIIALSLALSPPMRQAGRYWEIPLDVYPRMEQGAVILKRARPSEDFEAVRMFYEWIKGDGGRAVFKRYGFFLPLNPYHVKETS